MKMSDKARETRNEYYRNYRAKNKERIKEINERYWEKKAAVAAAEVGNANN